MNIWNEWQPNGTLCLTENSAYLFSQVPSVEVPDIICDFELCFWLGKFEYEVRKKDAELYPPKPLRQMCAGIQRHLRDNGLAGLEILPEPCEVPITRLS